MDTEGQRAVQRYIHLPVLQRTGNVPSRKQQQEPDEQRIGKAVFVSILPVVPGEGGAVQGKYIDGVMFDARKTGEIGMTDRVDIPGTETIKIKRQISMPATRCLVCGKWEYPEFNHDLYDAIITGEAHGICDSCRKAIEWAKERMEGR